MSQTAPATDNRSSRIDWIDFAKGLTLILVVIAHTVTLYERGSITRGVIFSFHMPLFFILSCATFRWSRDIEEYVGKLKKSAKHLLIPAIVTYIILIIVDIVNNSSLFLSAEFWRGKLYTLIFSSGLVTEFSSVYVPPIGMIWFFLSLFMGRAIFDWLHLKLNETMLFIISMLIGVAGVVMGQVYWLPFSFDITMAIIPFMYFGYRLKDFDPEKHIIRKLLICLAIWIFVIYITFPDWRNWTYLELAIRRYSLFPLCYIGAICGTLVICEISVLGSKVKYIFRPLIYFGRNSLYFFCVHILDQAWEKLYYTEGRQFVTAGKKLLIDIAVFAVFMLLKFLFGKILSAARSKRSS